MLSFENKGKCVNGIFCFKIVQPESKNLFSDIKGFIMFLLYYFNYF